MHRTIPVLRWISCTGFLFGLFFLAHPTPVKAQEKVGEVTVVTMTTGSIQFYESKEILKNVTNLNAKVVEVQQIKGEFKKVIFVAIAPGRSRVTFTDIKDRVEMVDVVVLSDRVTELRNLIQRAVPVGAVNVSSTDSGNAVILTGFVPSTDDARVVQQIAAQIFGTNVVNNVRIGGVQQVQVEVVVAIVNRSEARNMTFSWTNNGPNWFVSSIFGAPLAVTTSLAGSGASGFASSITQTGAANIPFGILNGTGSFMGFLQALRTEGLAKIYSEPRVMTLSGQTGQVVSGGEAPVLTASTGGTNVSYRQFGTVVSFLPIVLGNGKIHLDVSAEVSAIDAATSVSIAAAGAIAQAPGFKTRRAQAKVQLEDGQTVAIGGLIQNATNTTIQRVPVLGDIPFLGAAFTSKSSTEIEEELLILVTPRLVDGVDCCKIPQYLPGRETRNPDDFEFFLEGILEAPRGQRNISWNPFQYRGAHTWPGANPQYPCGDGSGCYGHGNGRNCANGSCGTSYPLGSPAMGGHANVGNGSSMPPSRYTSSVIPAGNRISVEPEVSFPIPHPMPQVREVQPNLGPAIPLPPVSFGPAGRQ